MSGNSKTDLYLDHIRSHILPFIDYSELQRSYETDMVYAKGILNRLHITMGLVYGGESLGGMDEGDVVVPGIIRGSRSGNLCIALLTLDLSSSGEHWGTDYLCKYGVISQDGNSPISNNDRVLASEVKEINDAYLPYDYAYTATIPDDIHVDFDSLHYQIKDILTDFHNHHAELLYEGEAAETPTKLALHEPDIYSDEATAALRERLIERLGGNLAEYFDTIHKLDTKDIAAWSFEIAAVTGAYHYLTEYHNFNASELDSLLRFQNPLKIVADKFDTAGMDDHSDIMQDIFDGQEELAGDYELMPDTSAEDALKQKLFDRLDDNMLTYRNDMLGASKETIFDMSEDIAAHYAAREYMKTAYDFKTGEVEYLLQFQDPLSMVAESWLVATDHFFTVGDVVTGVFEDKGSHGHFARVMDADNPAAMESAKVPGTEKPSVLDRIRAAEKEPKPPRKDKSPRDKSEQEH